MRDKDTITISDKARTTAIASLRKYFAENMDEELGDLKATLLLDYILAEHGPVIYNQALADAKNFIEESVTDLTGVRAQVEFPYYAQKRPR